MAQPERHGNDREGNVERTEILPLLGTVKRNGTWLMALCPAHPDGVKHGGKPEGFSLGLSDTGVLKCFTGCSFKDVITALRERAGVDRQRRPDNPNRWTVKAIYRYPVIRGEHAGRSIEHVRVERPDPTAAKGYEKKVIWRLAADDRRPPSDIGIQLADLSLFGLETLDGGDPDGWVNFPEGEKSQLALAARHMPAVCAGGGAGQRDFGDALLALRGRKVRIWPDNDPPGAEWASIMRRNLLAVGAAKVAIMPPMGGPGGDVFDFLAGGGQMERLLAGILLEDTIEFRGDAELGIRIPTEAGEFRFDVAEIDRSPRSLDCSLTVTWVSEQADGPYEQRINWLSASSREGLTRVLGKAFPEAKGLNWTALLSRVLDHIKRSLAEIDMATLEPPSIDSPVRRFLIEGYLPEKGGMLLHGPPKRGKSQTSLIFAIALDAGLRLPFLNVPRKARVMYINLERDAGSMLGRVGRINRALGLPFDRPLLMINRRGASLASIMHGVRTAIRRHSVECVVLDSISRAGYGSLIKDDVANAVTDDLNSLGVAWIAIGHQRRPDEEGNGSGHIFGSVHFDAAADSVVMMSSRQIGASLLIRLTVTDANDFRKPPALELAYDFDDEGLIAVRRPFEGDERVTMEDLNEAPSLAHVIARYIRDEGRPMGTQEIASAVKRRRVDVARVLNELARDGEIKRDTAGQKAVWQYVGESLSRSSGNMGQPRTTGTTGTGQVVPIGCPDPRPSPVFIRDGRDNLGGQPVSAPVPKPTMIRTPEEARDLEKCVFCDEEPEVYLGHLAIPCCLLHRHAIDEEAPDDLTETG